MPSKSSEPEESISELVERFRTGRDQEATFRLIFDRYYRLVRRYFGERGMPADQAENLCQETFLATYRALPGFRREADFDTWLFSIARRIFAGEVRRLVIRRRYLREVPIDRASEAVLRVRGSSEGPLQASLDRETRHRLETALETLPEQMRRCATLRLCYDLKYREIADELEISEDAVRVQLARARKRLRRELGESFPPAPP